MFVRTEGKEISGGSSPSLQFITHVPTKTEWVCKCSGLAILNQHNDGSPNTSAPTDSINEYRELLALRLYSFFEVATPQAVLSQQVISQSAQRMYEPILNDILE